MNKIMLVLTLLLTSCMDSSSKRNLTEKIRHDQNKKMHKESLYSIIKERNNKIIQQKMSVDKITLEFINNVNEDMKSLMEREFDSLVKKNIMSSESSSKLTKLYYNLANNIIGIEIEAKIYNELSKDKVENNLNKQNIFFRNLILESSSKDEVEKICSNINSNSMELLLNENISNKTEDEIKAKLIELIMDILIVVSQEDKNHFDQMSIKELITQYIKKKRENS